MGENSKHKNTAKISHYTVTSFQYMVTLPLLLISVHYNNCNAY